MCAEASFKTGKILAKVVLNYKMEALTGIHVGSSKETFEIGDVDNPVVKDPITGEPYIPGSSLKGKMRSLLEKKYFTISENKNAIEFFNKEYHSCQEEHCPVCSLFGASVTNPPRPGRVIVRDAFLDDESVKRLKKMDIPSFTEIKYENSINRLTAKANPRQMERIPRGVKFDVEIVYEVDDEELFKINLPWLFDGIRLLELDGIGGSVSRGYGKVKFELMNAKVYKITKEGIAEKDFEVKEKDTSEIVKEMWEYIFKNAEE